MNTKHNNQFLYLDGYNFFFWEIGVKTVAYIANIVFPYSFEYSVLNFS